MVDILNHCAIIRTWLATLAEIQGPLTHNTRDTDMTVRFYNTQTGAWFTECDHTDVSIQATLEDLGKQWAFEVER